MTTLIEAVNASATTENGALTNFSSLNSNVDFFFLVGASRGKDITSTFASALGEDAEVAVRILQWARDARDGAGERETFRKLFAYLITANVELASRVLAKMPELGRWDDVHVAFGTPLERDALRMIATALNTGDCLCAKWQPRQGAIANKIRSYMKMSPKQYRKHVVNLSNTVEQKMCSQDWQNIEYSHVPSVAAARYQKAFGRHDEVGYAEYKKKLVAGETTIKASAVYPYDIVRSLKNGDRVVASEQWKALPNYLAGSTENILPVVDVSDSMDSVNVSGSVTALDVAVSLGMYLSERMGGLFKDHFITFSGTPQLVKLQGDLGLRYDQMSQSNWGMNTDIQAVFQLILNSALANNVSQEQMPTKILILSDMEFDSCVKCNVSSSRLWHEDGEAFDLSAMSMIEDMYSQAGYKVPQIVFWNLKGRAGNVPVAYHKSGAALVSGFSPSIVKSVLGGEELTPIGVMLKTIMVPRYDV